MKIAVISASIRQGRQTHQVAEELVLKINHFEGTEAKLIDLGNYAFPLFEEVFDAENPQPHADDLRSLLEEAEAMLFVSPEYNGSYTSALKNLTDHYSKAQFSKKAIGVVSVSSGPIGGMRGALNMQELVLALSAFPIPQMLLVHEVQNKFNGEGDLIDGILAKKIDAYLREFLWFASAIAEKKERTLSEVQG